MSMSQEEIESLMNGLDITENENSKEEDTKEEDALEEDNDSKTMSEEDIEALIAQTSVSTESNEDNEVVDNDSIDDLLKELENSDSSSSDIESDDSIDDLINSLENKDDENNEIAASDVEKVENSKDEDTEAVDTSDIDELLEGLKSSSSDNDYLKDLDDLNINEEAETLDDLDLAKDEEIYENPKDRYKNVVSVDKINIPNQLGEVANDSEEKATKIFDALSYILEDNASLRKTVKGLDSFIQSQQKMLETLNAKFPNVKEFSDNLELVKSLADMPSDIQTRLSNRDKELFEAMELMQFHDINRQKIERVMNVVVNLSKQLNDILDDSCGNTANVPVSKHLPGDKSLDIVGNDDLESLIAEFGK